VKANSPPARQMDIENTGFAPGVRSMHALAGQGGPFDSGREQMAVPGLEVTAKSIERVSETIGADIVRQTHRRWTALYNWVCRS
jgi:hypothetical protein